MHKTLYLILLQITFLSSCHHGENNTPPTPPPTLDTTLLKGKWYSNYMSPSFFPTASYPLKGMITFQFIGRTYAGLGKTDEPEMKEHPYNWRFVCVTAGNSGGLDFFPGQERSNALAFVLGSEVYIGLGEYAHTKADGTEVTEYCKDFWIYNMPEQTWRECPYPFPEDSLQGMIAFGYEGKGYVGCGSDIPGTKGKLYVFDPEKGWSPKDANVHPYRRGMITFTCNESVYIGLGKSGNQYNGDIWRFEPQKSSCWQILAMQVKGLARSHAIAHILWPIQEGAEQLLLPNQEVPYLYIIGGEKEEATPECMIYDFKNSMWYQGTPPPAPLGPSIGFSITYPQDPKPTGIAIHRQQDNWEEMYYFKCRKEAEY